MDQPVTTDAIPVGESGGHQGEVVPAPRRAARGRSLGVNRFGAVYVLIIAFAVFSVLRPDTFPTLLNVRMLLISQSVLMIVSIGMLFPASAGEFDLSLGFLAGFTGIVVAWLSVFQGWHPYLAVLAGLVIATAVGAINGFFIVRIGVSSFISTLGSGTMLSGLTLWVSRGSVIYDLPKQLLELGQGRILGMQLPVYVMVVTVIVAAYIFHYRPYGRYLYAVGGGREAARLAGVNCGMLTFSTFVISAFLGGLGGILLAANGGAANPDGGVDLLMPAFAASFLGATTIVPGRFNVFGSVVAVFLLAVLVSGIQQMGAPHWVSPVFNGAALIVAVALAVSRSRK